MVNKHYHQHQLNLSNHLEGDELQQVNCFVCQQIQPNVGFTDNVKIDWLWVISYDDDMDEYCDKAKYDKTCRMACRDQRF